MTAGSERGAVLGSKQNDRNRWDVATGDVTHA
jgi:hypothetical protein